MYASAWPNIAWDGYRAEVGPINDTYMTEFFCFMDPDSDRLLAASDLSATPAALDTGLCTVGFSRHPRCVTPEADDHINAVVNLEVKHQKRDELLIWTRPPWPCVVIHESLLEKMQTAGFSGYALRPATVRFRDGFLSREYKRLLVTGWGGIARPESGIRLMDECPACLCKSYSSFSDSSQLVDKNQWTGEDFFVVWPLPYFIFVTNRVAEFISAARPKSYRLFRLDRDAERFIGRGGFTVGSLGESFPRALALKYGRPLQIA